ncbi:recombinase family protein [Paenibacillus larvae]|nr:recombinase family protein [Paenibacillus larvae]
MMIGYARVSSTDQNLDRQIQELESYGCEHIVVEKESGIVERPEFEKLLKQIRFKDVIVCQDLTRFGRSQIHILQVIEELRSKQAGLVTLKEHIDTREDNPYSDLIVSIFSATAEFERKMIKERQREGIDIAKKKGKYKGGTIQYHKNAKGKDKVIYEKIAQMLIHDESVIDIHRATGVARNTIYRIKKELESDNNGMVQVDANLEKIAKIRMGLRVENNSKFVRGKGKVREIIEHDLRYRFKMKIDKGEYVLYIHYTTVEALEKIVYDIIEEMSLEADLRNCFIEVDAHCDKLGLKW